MERVAQRSQCGDYRPMDLTDLSPKQLDLLERDAQRELNRRTQRRPMGAIRQLLRAAAAEAGYALDEVFPEFSKGRPVPRQPRQPAAVRPRTARVPKAAKAAAPLLDPAQQLVRALAKGDPKAAGLSQSLDGVRTAMGLAEDWPAFHAATEQAARRNWLHFRGNDHCVLTPDGLAETNR